jgi:hypothetical protein
MKVTKFFWGLAFLLVLVASTFSNRTLAVEGSEQEPILLLALFFALLPFGLGILKLIFRKF